MFGIKIVIFRNLQNQINSFNVRHAECGISITRKKAPRLFSIFRQNFKNDKNAADDVVAYFADLSKVI